MVPGTVRVHGSGEQSSSSEKRDKKGAFCPNKMGRREFLELTGSVVALAAVQYVGAVPAGLALRTLAQGPSSCAPGWLGTVLIDGESVTNWLPEHDSGSSASLALGPGLAGQAVQLDWDLGPGNWAQGKYTFSPGPVDLSGADIFGVSLRGGGAVETANTVAVMFADVNDVFYGYDMPGKANGLNQIDRWLINLSFPKKSFYHFFSLGPETQIDWSRINRFFFVVKKLCVANPGTGVVECSGGGAGRLCIDQVRYDTAANWPRQAQFETVSADPQIAAKTISYILSQQDPSTGLFVSWQEEEFEHPPARSWLYDQALVLIALTREGTWQDGTAANGAAQAAAKLVQFLTSHQKSDGHWARAWNPRTGDELADDGWVGDQAWWMMALSIYAGKSGDSSALASAQLGAAWLAPQIDAMGKVAGSTEGNVDAWWAMIATARFADADRIKAYLLGEDTVWDPDLRYWWRGYNDPVIAMDTAAWLSFFARHSRVNQPEWGRDALSFVRKTLLTRSEDGALCGFDGMGPVSIWNEGTAQYVAAGGEDAQTFLDMLISQQRPDGSMPGSTENWSSDTFSWLTTWSGLAPTAWLYFALTGAPFPSPAVISLPLITKYA